ncbi:hypothetical protein FZD51_13375 [Bacillus infantis]|uniref:Uncharacterized protein n=1 Tax=Bacillus infantis TaxID=324767 RepID=A0A5D4RB74_9BACI|nr:hypothetical protein FZD51_13375 [Bacillus infantis]
MHAHFLRAMQIPGRRFNVLRDCSGRAETPQRASSRRLSAAPRKAKCLERKPSAPVRSTNFTLNIVL